jgi:hypothetical protein
LNKPHILLPINELSYLKNAELLRFVSTYVAKLRLTAKASLQHFSPIRQTVRYKIKRAKIM